VTLRIVIYNGASSSGTWYIFDVDGNNAPGLALQGTVDSVVTLTRLQSWRLQWFGTTSNTGTAADNYAGTNDGMPNLLKCPFALSPLVATNNPLVVDTSAGRLRLATPMNPNATDVTPSAIASGDLMPWTTNGTVVDQNAPTLFQVYDGTPVAQGTNRFIRRLGLRPLAPHVSVSSAATPSSG
jgi:hypothetical protein